ncbi:hypothetical protein [Pararhodobacter oceanensis]|uniref:hypothetical protein n=1 Tax=Pararhodobacter oceanensis TaxID=2172121 RepID=UPI003A8FEA5B
MRTVSPPGWAKAARLSVTGQPRASAASRQSRSAPVYWTGGDLVAVPWWIWPSSNAAMPVGSGEKELVSVARQAMNVFMISGLLYRRR